MSAPPDERADEKGVRSENVRALRLGHGANCSSVGSVIDILFVSAAVSGAIFAAICAAMRDEPMRVVGSIDDEPQDETTDEEPS